MWVIKLGGSLFSHDQLPQWLALLAQLGGGRVVLVCGGGTLADEVRRLQGQWQFDDLPAHNMALLSMAQHAWLAKGIEPSLTLVDTEAQILKTLRCGKAAVWSPVGLVQSQADADSNWDVTGDSIALALAQRLNAEHLVLVKSCDLDGAANLDQLTDDGVLDTRFATWARNAAFPIQVLNVRQLAHMRSLLLGEVSLRA